MLHASYDHSKQSSDQSLPRLCLFTIDENNSEVEMLLLIKKIKSQKVFQFCRFEIFLHSCTCMSRDGNFACVIHPAVQSAIGKQ